MADMMYGTPLAATGGDLSEENSSDFYGGLNNNTNPRQRFPGLYVGNLTWWTTDQDVINLINSVGVTDVQEVKFFENRSNGQSKGFCVVTFSSETSLPTVMEKLPKLELYGQNPVVTPYNRQNLNLFESQTKTRPQINSNNGPNSHAAGIMGISSISGVHSGTQGLPYSGLNSGYNQGGGGPGLGGGGGPRGMPYHNNMRMQMRAPMRPMMRGTMPNAMNNGPMIPGGGHQPRMRFMQPQAWNNSSQGPYNAAPRMPQASLDPMTSRLGNSGKPADDLSQDMMSSQSSYYTPHHPSNSSQSDLYRGEPRDHRDLRDSHRDRERDDRDSNSRRLEDRSSRPDDRSLRHDDRSLRHQEERSTKLDDRSSSRRSGEERPSRREEGSSSLRREDGGSSSGRRAEERSSSRRDDKSSSSSSRRDKSHRSSDDRVRSRSRDRSRERSREKKERRERRERY